MEPALSFLDTPESMRPWVGAGLRYLLQETHDVPVDQAPDSETSPVPLQREKQSIRTSNDVRVNQVSFSPPWDSYFASACAKALNPKILLTYAELGIDMSGKADPKRRTVLASILGHLNFPKGSTVFWPAASYVEQQLVFDSEMFWKGWSNWQTPYIACFGQQALDAFVSPPLPSGSTLFLDQVTIIKLPSFAELINMFPHEQHLAVDPLRKLRL